MASQLRVKIRTYSYDLSAVWAQDTLPESITLTNNTGAPTELHQSSSNYSLLVALQACQIITWTYLTMRKQPQAGPSTHNFFVRCPAVSDRSPLLSQRKPLVKLLLPHSTGYSRSAIHNLQTVLFKAATLLCTAPITTLLAQHLLSLPAAAGHFL